MRPSALMLVLAAPLAAQQPAAPAPRPALRPAVADTGVFSPFPLPAANELRRPSGAPGPRYWQQRADYTIKATLDTSQAELRGTVTIRYTNNSPDTLRFVWLQLDQNLFRDQSVGSYLHPAESRFGASGFEGGFIIERFDQLTESPAPPPARGRRTGKPSPPKDARLASRIDDTMLYADLAVPLGPGQRTTFELAYHFSVPEHGADRMGRDGTLYQMAQWYPRMAVYDDVSGWNTFPYLGQGEFYLEYGDFEYYLTLPAGYIVGGTGTLENPLEVLTPTERARLAAAAKSDSAIRIVTVEDLQTGTARPRSEGDLTWHFKAQNVRDVAWAAAPDYLWDACSWEQVLAQAFYRPHAEGLWRDATKMSRFSVQHYSRWFPYPYPQITAVEGPVSGMEYPMVAMEAEGDTPEGLYNVLTHEIGHMWFPMIVGSDERRDMWMDEGLNTFMNTFSEEAYWKRGDQPVRRQEMREMTALDQSASAQPVMTAFADRLRTIANLNVASYTKPSLALLMLRNKVLGPEGFDPAFREYIRRWAFKHPKPADFFRTMEDVSGRDLSWFWREWFATTDVLDQSVEGVRQQLDVSGQHGYLIAVRNLGQAVMPVELQLTFDDGSTQLLKFPVEIWYNGDRFLTRIVTDRLMVRAQVNPDGMLADVQSANDVWTAPATPTH